jgi:hypothetical protein
MEEVVDFLVAGFPVAVDSAVSAAVVLAAVAHPDPGSWKKYPLATIQPGDTLMLKIQRSDPSLY